MLSVSLSDMAVGLCIAYHIAVTTDNDSLEAQVGLGRALYMCGRYEEAAGAGQRAVGIDAGSIGAQVNVARGALYMCGRCEEAVRAGQRAVGIDAGSIGAQVGLGRALYMCGRYEEAVAAYKAALALDAGNREAHSGLGLALGRWEKDAGR